MVSNPESELFNTVLPFKVFKDRIWYLFFQKITDNLSNNTEEDRLEKIRQKSTFIKQVFVEYSK